MIRYLLTPLYVLGTVVGTRIQWYAKITHAYPNFNEPVLLERESVSQIVKQLQQMEKKEIQVCVSKRMYN